MSMPNTENTMSMIALRSMQQQTDDIVRKAISNHIGQEVWILDDILSRLRVHSYPDSDLQTLTMDEIPILSIGKIESDFEFRDVSHFFRVTMSYKILNEKENKEVQNG